jgi:hypothetical protein
MDAMQQQRNFSDFNVAWKAKLAERQREEALGPPVESMDTFAIRDELKSYRPLTEADVNRDPAFLARRVALFKRLDGLLNHIR